MKHLSFLALLAVASTSALAAPAKSGKTELKTLNYCPIAGEKLGAKTVGDTTYKNYKIAFCCPGCPEAFAELNDKDKDKKIAKVVARQAKDEGKVKPKA